MEYNELYDKLIKSSEFREWKKKNPRAYLVHFLKIEEENKGEWQIGYFDKDKDRITTFLAGEQIGIVPEQEAFKEAKAIKKLLINKVKISSESALGIAQGLQKKSYPGELPIKKIFVLQNISRGQVWNITYITKGFSTINIKIDAETGKILKHEAASLVSFGAG